MAEPNRMLRRDAAPRRPSAPVTTTRPEEPVAKPQAGDVPISAPPTKSRWGWKLALCVALIGGVVYAGSQRRPIGPSAGALEVRILASRVAANQPARLKLGTYNIHGGRGTDGRLNLDRIAEMVRGLDFVGLNEVYGPHLWEQDDQATLLGRKLQMTPLYAPSEERWWHYRFGNAFLTRLDCESRLVVPLERRYGKSYRNLVHVRLRAPNGTPVNVVVTHIDRSDDRERREQLRTAADYFLALSPPAVLMGDLNSDSSEREIQRLIEAPDVVDPLGDKLGLKTPRRIDWILARGVESVDAGMTQVGPSDHPHVWAELTIPPAK